jgi:hypothetical protein
MKLAGLFGRYAPSHRRPLGAAGQSLGSKFLHSVHIFFFFDLHYVLVKKKKKKKQGAQNAHQYFEQGSFISK